MCERLALCVFMCLSAFVGWQTFAVLHILCRLIKLLAWSR